MTFPVSTVVTVPYCGACGRETFGEFARQDLNSDAICDACGADLLAFGWGGLAPPVIFDIQADTPLAGQFTATWVPNPGADSTDLRWQIDGGTFTTVVGATSPHIEIGPFNSLEVVSGETRSDVSGFKGPYGAEVSDTFA